MSDHHVPRQVRPGDFLTTRCTHSARSASGKHVWLTAVDTFVLVSVGEESELSTSIAFDVIHHVHGTLRIIGSRTREWMEPGSWPNAFVVLSECAE